MIAHEIADIQRWYAIHTHPRQEERATKNLAGWKVESFYPQIKVRASKTSRSVCKNFIIKPLFPRYVFARFQAGILLHKVWYTRGVHSVVSFGNSPTSVDDEIIAMIKLQVADDGYVRLNDDLVPGQRVLINEGPFKNLMGVLERKLKGEDRVMILLTTVNYQSHIVVNKELVAKAPLAA